MFLLFLRPVYKVYEWKLYREIRNGPMPRHVAIIPDGNRRWASIMGFEKSYGHLFGYNKMKEVLQWLNDLGIKAVTIYAMSYENCLYRSPEEKENLFNLINKGLIELGEYVDKYRVKVKVLGRLDLVPEEIVRNAKYIENKSSVYNDRILNILLCYGGRQEIIDAIKNLYEDIIKGVIDIEKLNEETLSKYLYTGFMGDLQEPDLVIRTSGEIRISNFLLWQSAYSELFFCEALWPEFRKIDLYRAIRSFQRRERRFGR
ncbi:MAG: polyprenyl diphosphate synthase [Sulfolobales archaeon]